MAKIIRMTEEMAKANPSLIGHKTYVVSFPLKIVTEIAVANGNIIINEKGFYGNITPKQAG